MACNCKGTSHLPVVMLWSGGFDSTLMLTNMLDSCPERDIILVTVQAAITGLRKLQKEEDARKRILTYIHTHYSKSVTKHIKVINQVIPVPEGDRDVANCKVPQVNRPYINEDIQAIGQPIIWSCNVIPLLPLECVLQLGYISEDHSFIKRDSIVNMIESAGKVSDKNIIVEFPMQYYTKIRVIEDLMNKHPDLLNLCISCESLTSQKRCTTCTCCIDIMKSLAVLSFRDSKYRELMEDWFEVTVSPVYKDHKKQSDDSSSDSIQLAVDECDCKADDCNIECDYKSESTCLLCGRSFTYEAPEGGVLCSRCQSLLKETRGDERCQQ